MGELKKTLPGQMKPKLGQRKPHVGQKNTQLGQSLCLEARNFTLGNHHGWGIEASGWAKNTFVAFYKDTLTYHQTSVWVKEASVWGSVK